MSSKKQDVINQYDFFKSCAVKYLQKGKVESAVKYCELTAHLGYIYNFRFCDDDLEEIVEDISEIIIDGECLTYTPITDRVVFYDSFASNRVLTLQYLRAIFSWGFEVLFITTQDKISDDVLYELNKYPKSVIFQLGKSDSFSYKVKNCLKAIINFQPKNVFLHLLPWDIFGVCVFNKVSCSNRFLINLTDHAFWLGKNCSDFILEYRNYGVNVSLHHRKIPVNKLLMQPYYPIASKMDFQGLPIEKGPNIFAFSGASFYKMYGYNGFFLDLINKVLVNNKNVIFFVSGDGNDKPIRKFIEKHKLQNRLILLGNRLDVNEVIKNIDIYINTFPIGGGLMSQMAALHRKPIIAFSNEDLFALNDVEAFLNVQKTNTLVRDSVDDFLNYFNKLVHNGNERYENITLTENSVITPEKFNALLLENINRRSSVESQELNEEIIKGDCIFELYLDIESNFVKSHKLIIWHTVKGLIFKDKFSIAIPVFWKKFTSKVSEYLN